MVVNNAGESQSGPFEELPREALERLFQVNVLGHVDFTQRFLPAMRASARQGSGGRMLRKLNRNEARGISAERVAREILRPIRGTRPRAHYAVGSMARVAFPLARLVPQQVLLNIISAKHDL